MKFLIAVAAILALFAVAESGHYGGGGGGDGGHGGYATPIVHAGPVVTKVFGPPPAPFYQPVPIPDHGYDRHVIIQPAHAIVTKGEGIGFSHHHH